MDTTKVLSQLYQLDDEIDDLEKSLSPLLKTVLSETASKLPLLDKAKLYTLVTYAIESILFSYLRLNGVKARDHPVFAELTRMKQYFNKMKTAETPLGKRQNLSLDKNAAGRIIKAGLSSNNKYGLQRVEQQGKPRAKKKPKNKDTEVSVKDEPGLEQGSKGFGFILSLQDEEILHQLDEEECRRYETDGDEHEEDEALLRR